MADARDRSPEPGRELYHHLATFERVFNRAARRLRTILQTRDPRRRLQWNRIAIFVAPPIFLDPDGRRGHRDGGWLRRPGTSVSRRCSCG